MTSSIFTVDGHAFQFRLLHNALDFIDAAVESVAGKPSARAIKYALIHLAMGIELVFKARLAQEHWTLVLSNPGKVTYEDYLAGRCVSVGFAEALDRLEKVARISIPKPDRKVLDDLQRRRNRLVHLHVHEASTDAATAVMVRPLEIVMTFLAEQLDIPAGSDVEDDLVRSIRGRLGEFKEFADVRYAEVEKQLEKLGSPETFPCPSCLQHLAILDGGLRCSFCHGAATGEAGAWEFAGQILGSDPYLVAKGRSENCVFVCPECGSEALVDQGAYDYVEDGDMTRFLCLNCDFTAADGELDTCIRCGGLYLHEEGGMSICDTCFENLD